MHYLRLKKRKKIYNILQLRVHPNIIVFKHKIDKSPKDKIYDIDLTYITSWILVLHLKEMIQNQVVFLQTLEFTFLICFLIFGDLKKI